MPIADRFVYIVAADALARGGLAALIANAPGWQIGGQASPPDAQAEFEQTAFTLPDLLLWDAGWQPADTLPILTAIQDDNPTLSTLLLLEDVENAPLFAPLRVAGLLLRTVEPERLLAAMQAVATGLLVIEPELRFQTDFWPPTPDDTGQPLPGERLPEEQLSVGPPAEPLTPRELDVLHLVAEGLPNKAIARHLAISEHTVKFHMNSILGKLNAQSRTEAVVTAGRAGIIQV